jgi:hypothetical protein
MIAAEKRHRQLFGMPALRPPLEVLPPGKGQLSERQERSGKALACRGVSPPALVLLLSLLFPCMGKKGVMTAAVLDSCRPGALEASSPADGVGRA